MFLSKNAQVTINTLRGERNCINEFKAEICDAIDVIMFMYRNRASETEKEKLVNAVDTLTIYNELLDELSEEE